MVETHNTNAYPLFSTHLIFNCLWVYILGKEIEDFDGKWLFLILILITSASSNYAQYAFSGPSIFGGLSGVVYGLLGFVLFKKHFQELINIHSHRQFIYSCLFGYLLVLQDS